MMLLFAGHFRRWEWGSSLSAIFILFGGGTASMAVSRKKLRPEAFLEVSAVFPI
jgi:hypothetical protein